MTYLQHSHAHDVLQVACYTMTMVSSFFQAVVVHPHLISGDSALQNVTAFTFVMLEVGQ
jgi:hypothetical protein